MMNIEKIALMLLSCVLGVVPAVADDAHHDSHAAPAAKQAAAAPAKAAPAAQADAHAAAAAPEQAAAAKEEAATKPAPRKAKRKKPKAEAKPAADTKHADAAHGDSHATPVPPSIAPTTRVRVRDRASAAAAVAAAQATDDHGAPAAGAASAGHGDGHAAAPVAADHANAAPAAAAHSAHDAPAVPASIEPTRRARVKATLPARSLPAPSTAAAHDSPAAHDSHAAQAAADAHDAHGHHDAHHGAAHAQPVASPKAELAHVADAGAGSMEPTASSADCSPPLKAEVAALFDRWNASLRTGDPKKVVANYASDSVLLPTVSNRARFTVAEKEEYFMHFLQRRPQGYIDDRLIEVDCNSATDAGLYTFRFSDGSSVKARYSFAYKKINGQWLITSHHSSGMPEKPAAPVAHAGEPHAPVKAADTGVQNKGWVRFP